MILRNITEVFSRKSESVRVKRGCKFWPWRPCLRAIFFQEKGTSYRPMPLRAKRSCLVVLKYYKKKSGKVALAREKFPNFCDKTKLLSQYIIFPMLSSALSQSWITTEKNPSTSVLRLKNWFRHSCLNSLSWCVPKPVQPWPTGKKWTSSFYFIFSHFFRPHTIHQ